MSDVDPGACYLDRSNSEPALLADCPATQRQNVRFTGDGTPSTGAVVFLACGG